MKFSGYTTMAAAVAALLLAACGGGGADSGASGTGEATAIAGLTLSGTAATGLALASSSVQVKCASGNGSATTDGNGTYTVTLVNGSLPCMLRVTGEVDGTTVTLHSVADTGATSGNSTTATANVTPLTEMIVAQAAGVMPSELFDTFEAGHAQITPEAISAARSQVVNGLRDATGIDLGTIDPLKAPLKAATANAPDQGDEHDKLLDALKAKVDTAALPQVVNQLVAAKTGGESAPVKLADVMKAVDLGNLAGCPAAMSGKYRFLNYPGASWVRELDFKNARMLHPELAPYQITAHPDQPCRFSISNPNVTIDVAMGPSGIGAWRMQGANSSQSSIGYLFPVQSHPVSALAGQWSYIASGHDWTAGEHEAGRLTLDTSGAIASTCRYDTTTWECEANVWDDGDATALVPAKDGAFDLAGTTEPIDMYAYKAPNGSLVILAGKTPAEAQSFEKGMVFVASKLKPLGLPVSGHVHAYWDIETTMVTGQSGHTASLGPTAQTITVTATDSAAGTFTRHRQSDGRIDTMRINHPVDGVRQRVPSTWNHPTYGTVHLPATYQIPLEGLGLQITVNADLGNHFYAISVARP